MSSNPYQSADISDPSTGRLFLLAYRDFQLRCVPMLEKHGYGNLAAAHITALTHIDMGGTRIVTLAERANMTKQSMGDLIQELETGGYVARMRDPNDKRAVIISLTGRGQQFLTDALAITRAIDDAYATVLGVKGVTQLRQLLIEIVKHTADTNG